MSENTGTPPESERAVLRRNQVLDAAAIWFRNHGFHGASMAQISTTAGRSPGHIYHYFDSKEAIIAAIVERDLDKCLEWTKVFSNSDNIMQTMIDGVDQGVEENTSRDNAALMAEIMAESARNPQIAETVQQAHKVAISRLMELLAKEQQQRQGVSSHDVAVKAELMGAMFDGLLLTSIRNPVLDKAAVTQLMRQTIQFLLTL